MQSLELKGEPMKSGRERTKSSRAFRFAFQAARLRTHFYIDNLSVTFSGFSCLHTIFTSPFLVNYINFPLNWENKNSLLCKLWFVTGNQTVRVFAISKQKVNLIFCCLINIYQQTIEQCKYVTPRLILSCRVARAIDSCSLDSPNA